LIPLLIFENHDCFYTLIFAIVRFSMTNTIINLTNPPFLLTARVDLGIPMYELWGTVFNDSFY